MKFSLTAFAFAATLIVSTGTAFAQAPAGAPAGSTGTCKDGSFTSNETKKGACSGHNGVKDWYGAPAGATKMEPASAAATSKPVAPATTTKTASPAPSAAPAAGGGPGQVWVNTSSKVYHCAGTKYYGKTKQGEYMTETEAKAVGIMQTTARPAPATKTASRP
jgi:hypothetical protein